MSNETESTPAVSEATPAETPAPSVDSASTEPAAPAITPPAQPTPEESQAAAWQQMARRELAARQREATAHALEEKIAAQSKAVEEWKKAIEAGKSDPLTFMRQQFGLDFEGLARQHILKEPATPATPLPPEFAEVKRELEALRKWKDEFDLQQSQAASKAHVEEQVRSARQYLAEQIESCRKSPEEFELVLSAPNEASPVFVDLLQQAYALAGRDLDDTELRALWTRTEAILTERHTKLLDRFAASKRFANRFAPKAAAPDVPAAAAATPAPALKTLTNAAARPIAAAPAVTKGPKTRADVERERLELIRQKYPPNTPTK